MITVDTAGSGISAAIVARPEISAQPMPPSKTTDTADGRPSPEHPQPGNSSSRVTEPEKRFADNIPVIAGPSPAFEASLLELEADIENVIKRVYAEREKARSGDAVKLDQVPSPPETEVEPAAALPDQDDAGPTPYDAAPEQVEV